MTALVGHEWRAAWRRAFPEVLVLGGMLLVWAVFLRNAFPLASGPGRLEAGIFLAALVTEAFLPLAAFRRAWRSVAREWRDGTACFWLRARPREERLLLAKAAGAVLVAATYGGAVLALALLLEAALLLTAAPAGPLADLFGTSGSPASTLLALLRWGIADTLLAVAASVPAAVLGLAAVFGPGGPSSSRQTGWSRLRIGWLLAAVAVWALLTSLPPLFHLVRLGPGRLGLGFAPAAGAEIFVPLLPVFAVSLWPLLLAWAGAALLLPVEAWWLRHRAACR